MANSKAALAALKELSGALSPASQSAAAYSAIRQAFVTALSSEAQKFIDGGDRRSTINAARRAVTESYASAADVASGGPLETADLAAFNEKVAAQFDALEGFWSDLKAQAKSGNPVLPSDRVEMYARSLDGAWNTIRASAQKNMMVRWVVGPTEESCKDCSRLDQQEHRLRWFLDKGFIPGTPGTEALNCKGFQCLCSWHTLDGQPFSYDTA